MCSGIFAWFKEVALLLPVCALPCLCRRLLLHGTRKLLAPVHSPEPCQLRFTAAWLGSWARALLPALPGGWYPLGEGRDVAAWGLLVQQVSSHLHGGMKPYSVKNHISGWNNAKIKKVVCSEGLRVTPQAMRYEASALSVALQKR